MEKAKINDEEKNAVEESSISTKQDSDSPPINERLGTDLEPAIVSKRSKHSIKNRCQTIKPYLDREQNVSNLLTV